MSGKSIRLHHSVCIININSIDIDNFKHLKVKLSKLFLARIQSRDHISVLIPTHNDEKEKSRNFEVKYIAHLHFPLTSVHA